MKFDVGPFRFFRANNDTLSVSLKCLKERPFGWEWGWNDDLCHFVRPLVHFRVGKLMVSYLEFFDGGFEARLLGFWIIPSWKKEKK